MTQRIEFFDTKFTTALDGWLVRMEWSPAGWSVCLTLLIFPCTIKSRSSLLALAHLGGTEYFVQCRVVGSQITLDGVQPRDALMVCSSSLVDEPLGSSWHLHHHPHVQCAQIWRYAVTGLLLWAYGGTKNHANGDRVKSSQLHSHLQLHQMSTNLCKSFTVRLHNHWSHHRRSNHTRNMSLHCLMIYHDAA